MKKLILLLSLVLACMKCFSQTALVVQLRSGEKIYLPFAETPSVSFLNNDKMIVNGKGQLEYSISDVDCFEFCDVADGIMPTVINNPEAIIRNGIVVISGLSPKENVNIYSLDGKNMSSTIASDEGTVSVSLIPFSKGTYIIKSKSVNIKTYKR